jgi:PKHD-type hydroxylase
MLRIIPGLIKPSEVKEIVDDLETADFIDGSATAGRKARQVKNNLQLEEGTAEQQKLSAMVFQAIQGHSEIGKATMPSRVSSILFNRYDAGMEYGWHMDNAIRQLRGGTLRTDVSITIFLSDPSTYQGGELVIETEVGSQPVKLDAGDAVLYSSTTLHRVNPIESGTRLAAVAWIESLIGDPFRREILAELHSVRQWLTEHHPNSQEDNAMAKACGNLVRLWSA